MSAGDFTLNLQRIDEATHWLQTLRDGAMDESTLARWLEWSSDARNLEEFERLQGIWDGVGVLREQGLVSPPRERSFNPLPAGMKIAASLVLGLGLSALLVWRLTDKPATNYQTSVAVIDDIPLPDGSRMQLGASSTVHTRFTAQSRVIEVQSGEAYFEVAKDPHRPFLVSTGPVTVTALGTAFNIHKGNERVRVTVTDGTISVSADDTVAPVKVEAGQQVNYSAADHRMSVASTDVQIATGWRSGVLKFVDEPLQNVIADLNRYTGRKIVIEDPKLNALPYTGTVFAGRIDQWLVAVQDAFPLYIEEQDRDSVRLRMK